MILPILAAVAVQAIVRYAVKEGIEFVLDKAKDAAVQAIVKKARDYAEKRLLAEAKKECPTCDPADYLKTVKDPCSLLNEGKGSGKYRGGSDDIMSGRKPKNTKPLPSGDGRFV